METIFCSRACPKSLIKDLCEMFANGEPLTKLKPSDTMLDVESCPWFTLKLIASGRGSGLKFAAFCIQQGPGVWSREIKLVLFLYCINSEGCKNKWKIMWFHVPLRLFVCLVGCTNASFLIIFKAYFEFSIMSVSICVLSLARARARAHTHRVPQKLQISKKQRVE